MQMSSKYIVLHMQNIANSTDINFNPKRAGLFGPISQPGGGFRPPPISKTD